MVVTSSGQGYDFRAGKMFFMSLLVIDTVKVLFCLKLRIDLLVIRYKVKHVLEKIGISYQLAIFDFSTPTRFCYEVMMHGSDISIT